MENNILASILEKATKQEKSKKREKTVSIYLYEEEKDCLVEKAKHHKSLNSFIIEILKEVGVFDCDNSNKKG